ncbi:MAG: hypothetical protein H0X08_03935 [Blastocatellia bacterium]|nr:hypothetical protein [Blastocatellia bacterium]
MAENLYCPRCSKSFAAGISYCRTCGLSLDGVIALVHGDTDSAAEIKKRPNVGLMQAGIGIFILGLVVALLNAAMGSLNLFPGEYGSVVFFVLTAIGMALLGLGFVFPKKHYVARRPSLKMEKAKETQITTSQLGELPATLYEDGDAEIRAWTSITEHTTRHLR